MQQDTDFRISIAGAQEKTALLWHDNRWCRPTGVTPTSHILKLPIGQTPRIIRGQDQGTVYLISEGKFTAPWGDSSIN